MKLCTNMKLENVTISLIDIDKESISDVWTLNIILELKALDLKPSEQLLKNICFKLIQIP